MVSLNTLQQQSFDTIVNRGQNLCLNAKGGTGKTLTANRIVLAMAEKGYTVLPVAYTGKAASHLTDGITAHRSSGLGIGTDSVLPKGAPPEKRMWKGMTRITIKGAAIKADARWADEKLLVVLDEISQLSSEDARLWYDVGMYRRYDIGKATCPPIFLLSGDFGQFLPIKGNLLFEPAEYTYYRAGTEIQEKLILPSIFEDIKPELINLTKVERQNDSKYLKALNWLYYGIAVHPIILDRVRATVPNDVPNYFFNNALVTQENIARVDNFRNNASQTYVALCATLTEAEKKYLLPVEPEMIVYIGAPFTITVNVYDSLKNEMLVSNGEVVTVIGLNQRSINVRTAKGRQIELGYVNHYLPFNQNNGKKKAFLFLPGYLGNACSIMKVQGETYQSSVCFAVWQLISGRLRSLKSYPGALYTICSRTTELDYLYFDTSYGLEATIDLIKESLTVNPKVLNFLLKGMEPLWFVDGRKEKVVIEITEILLYKVEGPIQFYRADYDSTCLLTGIETKIVCCFSITGDTIQFLYSGIIDKYGKINPQHLEYVEIYTKLFKSLIHQRLKHVQ